MSPSLSERRRSTQSAAQQDRAAIEDLHSPSRRPSGGELWAIRCLLLIAAAAVCYGLRPFELPRGPAALAGFFFAALVLVVESRSRCGEPVRVLGGAIGAATGILV